MKNLMIIQVKISNAFDSTTREFEVTFPKSTPFNDITDLHEFFTKENPDCHVNFSSHKLFIMGMPYNQKRDEEKLDRLEMTWEEYENKWCYTKF